MTWLHPFRNWLPRRPLQKRPSQRLTRVPLSLEALEPRWQPAVIPVANLNDSGAGSLRQALADAAAMAGTDDIVFASNLTGPLTLSSGPLMVDSSVNIIGFQDATHFVNISGNNLTRVFDVDVGGGSVSISDLGIINGRAADGGPGGGIWVESATFFNLTRCVVRNNTVVAGANGFGGGVAFTSGEVGTFTDCTFESNTAGSFGGGVSIFGIATVLRCTLVGNHASAGGGGIAVFGGGPSLQLLNSTLSRNTASSVGGALAVGGSAAITATTITDNFASQGGAVFTDGGSVTLQSTLLAGNRRSNPMAGPDVQGLAATFTSLGHNLVGVDSLGPTVFNAAGDQTGTLATPLDPRLGPLQNYGGLTRTHALLHDSPALDAGANAVLGAPFSLFTDQRGVGRQFDGNNDGTPQVDVGAVEMRSFQVTTNADSGAGSLRSALNNANANAGTDIIRFNLPAGQLTITPATALPTATDGILLDATSQPGFSGTPLVTLDGVAAPFNVSGVSLGTGASGSIVRGLNVVRFNKWGLSYAIHVNGASGVLIAGNILGTDATGAGGLGNFAGVVVDNGASNTIGGATAADRNVIAGNDFYGILLANANANKVQGNYIGFSPAGSGASYTQDFGVDIIGDAALGNLIGTNADGVNDAAEGNVISGNDGIGIFILGGASNNTVAGNKIGVAPDGFTPLPNNQDGVQIDTGSSNNTIGGATPSAGNIIAYNNGEGVQIDSGTGNVVRHNSLFDNLGLGINLGQFTGATANDPTDADAGPNNLQNYPVITSLTLGGANVFIDFNVPGATSNLTIDFYRADSSLREGQTYLGTTTYTATGGTQMTSFIPLVPLIEADRVVATATDGAGNTSEFTVLGSTFRWKQSAGGSWTDPANWNLVDGVGDFPNALDDVAIFADPANEGSGTIPVTIPDDTTITVGKILFDQTAYDYVVSAAGSGRLVFDVSAGQAAVDALDNSNLLAAPATLTDPLRVTVAESVTFTISGDLSGPGGLTKDGPGTLILTGNNTYAGGTTTLHGILQVSGGAVAAVPAPVVQEGATFTIDAGGTVTYTGTISGPGGFTKTGEGTVILTGINTYTGPTVISFGTVQIAPGGTLGNGSSVIIQEDGTLNLNNNNLTIGSLSGEAGSRVQLGSGTLFVGNNHTNTNDVGDQDVIDLPPFDGLISGTGGVVKQGVGTMLLTANNTYSGTTVVQRGTLLVNGTQPASAILIQGGILGGTGTTGPVNIAPATPSLTAFGAAAFSAFSAVPVVSVADASVSEGNSGQRFLEFLVTLSVPVSTPVTLTFATSNGTARATNLLVSSLPGDYETRRSTLISTNPLPIVFNPGETVKSIFVPVNGDTVVESNETLSVRLANLSTNAVYGTSVAVGTIFDDDAASALPDAGILPGSSPGILHVGNLNAFAPQSYLGVEISGTTPGTQHDQVHTAGPINLNNAILNVQLVSFTPSVGQSFVIINNEGPNPVAGTFVGLPEGQTFAVGGTLFRITYQGSPNGRSVVLTAVAPGPEDVSALVAVTRGGFRFNRTTQRFVQVVTVVNQSSRVLQGPVSLVLQNLTSGVTLFNASGTATGGHPFVNLNLAGNVFNPGQSVTLTLEFVNPGLLSINYSTRVLAGPGTR